MKNLVKNVQNNNFLQKMWQNGDTIILGVSGGPDSMCLLDVMARIAKKESLTIVVAHVNYGLRGEDSIADQILVERVAQRHGFVCEVKEYLDIQKGSESQWRKMRYDFFEKMRKKYEAQVIAVAHNKNDQAETLLLRLLRGSGLVGLSGMRWRSKNDVIRPFLNVSRADVLSYCEKHALSYNLDKTNDDNVYTRNNIRNNLLPYLEKEFNPRIVDVLANSATTIADDYAMLRKNIVVFWNYIEKKEKIIFSVQKFLKNDVSMQRLSLRIMIKILRGTTKNIERGVVEEMRKMIASTKGKNQEFVGKDLKMLKKGDTVELMCL
ncbi:MAG: tRNA lysidine(34) synthetase TilS [Candidatus Moraniibacteriota bacterium]|nr:MAG: tRNA lysidine(34) synthetase TilS [Candidatus Moranbacteria bacterium]